MEHTKPHVRNPKLWVPSLYLAQGLPFFVHGVDLHVAEGEFMVFVVPSGCRPKELSGGQRQRVAIGRGTHG